MKKVISFSLWGQDPKYLKGAIKNAELAREIYPDWICRFYCALSVPFAVINDLSSRENVELVQIPEWGNWEGLYWRFWAASEADVDVVISRDTDSRLNYREKEAVDQWLSSNKGMHIMRDHPYHGYSVLGGMWGAKKGTIKDIKSLIKDFSTSDQYGTDYEFWRQIGLPAVGVDNIMVHDEFFENKPFPTKRNGLEFVGKVFDENEKTVEEHERALEAHMHMRNQKEWGKKLGNINELYIHHHMGLGDHICLNGLVRYVIENSDYDRYHLFCKEKYRTMLHTLYTDLIETGKFNLLGISNDENKEIIEANQASSKASLFRVGFSDYQEQEGVSCDEAFYSLAKVPQEQKYNSFNISRDLEAEKKIFDICYDFR